MGDADHRAAAFDEQAALEELERLRLAITDYRRERNEAEAEFEAFVRSFRTPPPVPDVSERPPSVGRRPRASAPDHAVAHDEWLPGPAPPPLVSSALPPPAAAAPEPLIPSPVETPEAPSHIDVAAPLRPAPPVPIRRVVVVAILLAVILGATALLMQSWRVPSGSAPGVVVRPPAARTPALAPPAIAPAAPAAAPPADAAQTPAAVLTTARRVWVRVVVDGKREVERELEGDARIALTGRTIVIRTGDAGAVRLTINGVDRGPLGRDGEVVTRTFTVRGE